MARFLLLACLTANLLAQQTAKVNGIDMYYESHGTGEPLVLLHGFNSSGHAWKPVLNQFTQRYRIIVPDLRGHGSSNNPSDFTHRQSARNVYALLDGLGVQRLKAMGIGTGGMTLLHMATSQRERIDAMVLSEQLLIFRLRRAQVRPEVSHEVTHGHGASRWTETLRCHDPGHDQSW